MTTTKLYDDLGLPPDASKEDIRKAYRKKAQQAHPDHGGTEEAFHQIELAHRILSDEEARKHYDSTGEIRGERANRPKPSTLEEEAEAALSTAFQSVLDSMGADALYMNVLEVVESRLEGAIEGAQNLINKASKRVGLLKKIEKKLSKKKNKKNDPLRKSLTSAICSGNSTVESNKRTLKILRKTLTLLHEYEYTPDEIKENTTVRDWRRPGLRFTIPGYGA